MNAMASQITCVSIVCSIVYSGTDQRKQQSSASLSFVRGIHWWPVDSPHKVPVTPKCSPLMTSTCMHEEEVQLRELFDPKKWQKMQFYIFQCMLPKINSSRKGPNLFHCVLYSHAGNIDCNGIYMADVRLVPSQWETALQSNAVSHWLGANVESALLDICPLQKRVSCHVFSAKYNELYTYHIISGQRIKNQHKKLTLEFYHWPTGKLLHVSSVQCSKQSQILFLIYRIL